MELEKFVEQFAGQFFDTPAEMIKADTEFRQLDEWSSMTGLCILSMIKGMSMASFLIRISSNNVLPSKTCLRRL